ncbi:MAG: hypothetical protein FJ138_17600 [Deltaproteobacteria bacterium]|nr:hypothetical protein [Deltaproteobacteria bacterium]
MLYLLSYFGSVNLAYFHRWQRRGIGHAMVVKRAEGGEGGSAAASKYSLTAEKGGGGDVSYREEVSWARLGGGMKRWRVARAAGGAWTNDILERDRASFIPANDYERIAARVSEFAELLVDVSPERKREAILDRVLADREHLRRAPTSSAARDRGARGADGTGRPQRGRITRWLGVVSRRAEAESGALSLSFFLRMSLRLMPFITSPLRLPRLALKRPSVQRGLSTSAPSLGDR